MLFDGYVDDPREGEWFATADRGEIDDEGRLWILGRVDDVVISGGVNVPLTAVERALRLVEGVGDVAVVGVDDPEWGARVVAAVVPADAVCLDGLRLDLLRDAVTEGGLPREWAPRQLLLVDELPLVPGGKIDRARIRGARVGRPALSPTGSGGRDGFVHRRLTADHVPLASDRARVVEHRDHDGGDVGTRDLAALRPCRPGSPGRCRRRR